MEVHRQKLKKNYAEDLELSKDRRRAEKVGFDKTLPLLPLNISAVNPPFLAGRLPVLEAVFLSPYFKRNLHVFENNQFSNIKVIVYENDLRRE